MTREERESCIGTIELLRKLAFNIHGVMDVIDAENCDKLIKVLKSETAVSYLDGYNDGYKEALKSEPCEDAISRQAAIDAIRKIHPVDTEYDCTLYDKLDVMYVLKELPPDNPQPKTGHWMDNHNGTYTCDECGCNHSRSNYCPDCGCRMFEPQESEDKE